MRVYYDRDADISRILDGLADDTDNFIKLLLHST